MKIMIKRGDDLNKLLNSLAMEIVDANIYHRLYLDLINSRKDYARVFRQSNTFWHFTLDALNDARMIRLCRIFDQESNSLNLVNLVETIKANIHFFQEEHFRERLKENAFVNSLTEVARIPDEAQLDKDIWFSSQQNPLVKKLTIWRHNLIAHKGAKISLGKNEILANHPLSLGEIESLLDECFIVLNRYSSLYRASTYSRKVIGHDDYKSLLKFVEMGLQKWDEDIHKEIQARKRNVEQDKQAGSE